MFGTLFATLLTLASLACAITVAVQSSWVVGAQASSGLFHYCGAGPTGPCEYSLWYTTNGIQIGGVNYHGFPSEGLKTAAVLWLSAIIIMAVCALLAGFANCLNCCCLCCLSMPILLLTGLGMFAASALTTAAVCLVAANYGQFAVFSLGVSMCGANAGNFEIGSCSVGWAYALAIAIPVMSLVAAILFTPLCTTIGGRAIKTVV